MPIAATNRASTRPIPTIGRPCYATTCNSRSRARSPAATARPRWRSARDIATAYLGAGASASARLIGSATYYAQGLYGDVDAVLAMAEPANAMEKVFRHYARGEALARRGQAAAVGAEAAAIAAIRRGTDAPALGAGGTPLAAVLQSVLEGRAAMLAGNMRAATDAYRAAMDGQLAADWNFDPPLFWYSVRRSLAAALLGAGDAAGARESPQRIAPALAERRASALRAVAGGAAARSCGRGPARAFAGAGGLGRGCDRGAAGAHLI